MKPMNYFDAYLKNVKLTCLVLAKHNDISIQEDEAGNIWISEDGVECFKIRGWYTAYNEVRKIMARKELLDIESER